MVLQRRLPVGGLHLVGRRSAIKAKHLVRVNRRWFVILKITMGGHDERNFGRVEFLTDERYLELGGVSLTC